MREVLKPSTVESLLVSNVEIVNKTNENTLRIAVFQQSAPLVSGQIVAWRVASPAANGGRSRVLVPDEYTMQVLSRDPGIDNISNQVSWNGYTAHLGLDVTPDVTGRKTLSLKLEGTNVSPEGHIQTSIPSDTGQQVLLEVYKEGSLILPQVPVTPGFTADLIINPTFYLAVVTQVTQPGAILQAHTIQTTTTAIKPGQRGTVSGSLQTGYSIAVD